MVGLILSLISFEGLDDFHVAVLNECKLSDSLPKYILKIIYIAAEKSMI